MTNKAVNKLFAKTKFSLEEKVHIINDYENAKRILEWLDENSLIDHEHKNVCVEELAKSYAAFLPDAREFLEGVLNC